VLKVTLNPDQSAHPKCSVTPVFSVDTFCDMTQLRGTNEQLGKSSRILSGMMRR